MNEAAVTKRATVAEYAEQRLPGSRPAPHEPSRLALFQDSADPLDVDASPDSTVAFDPRPFFAKLPLGKSSRVYPRGAAIFSQGAIADAIFWIVDGEVKLSVVSHDGKEAVIGLLPHGNFLGEGCLAGRPLYMSTAAAMLPTTVIRVPREAMTGLLHREPTFAEGFSVYLLSRHIRMEQDLLDQLFNSSEKRLARLLLLMAREGENGAATPMIDKLSHETLAEMIGTTRSRVTFFLNRFRRLGFIDYKDRLRVHSSLRLVLDD
jgi:CRP-like cAMP-binding protein